MPLPLSLHLVVGGALGALALGAALFCLGRCAWLLREEWRYRRAAPDGTEARSCRYCFLGRARLMEHSRRVEADDLVDVRCFVCTSCGLPQWTVAREPVVKIAS